MLVRTLLILVHVLVVPALVWMSTRSTIALMLVMIVVVIVIVMVVATLKVPSPMPITLIIVIVTAIVIVVAATSLVCYHACYEELVSINCYFEQIPFVPISKF